ncbi:MAG: methionine aminotransferase [Chryseolinea sp.]
MKIHSKISDVGTSIFSVMSKMALDYGAINLSQGFPDFMIDEQLIDLVTRFMKEGHNQYAPMPGTPALRKSIAEVVKSSFNREVNWETEITISSGATESIYAIISAFIAPGDEVIIFDPSYDSYNPSVRLNGGIPVHINLNNKDYGVDWQHVKSKIGTSTRMIIINTPHNPSGAILRDSDLRELEKIAVEHDLLVLSDEVYERLIYDGAVHQSVLRYPALADRSLAVFSFGKTFHATGWKVGYTVANEALTAEIRRAHQFVVFSVNTPVQLALAEYLKDPVHYLSLRDFYQKKRDFFLSQIKGCSFDPIVSHGSYFQLLSYKAISNKPDVQMAEEMTKNLKVASIPVSVFYQDKTDNRILRFCFAKKQETMEKACAILRTL